jgi:hypothetical protein
MFEQRLTSTLTAGYWTDTWHFAIFSYMFKRPIEITYLYSFPHNPGYVFLHHRCTTLALQRIIGDQDWFVSSAIILYNHNMSQPLNKDAVLEHWVALNRTLPRHKPYHDRAIDLVVEMDDERTKADRPVNNNISANHRKEKQKNKRKEKRNSKRRADRLANRSATDAAIRSAATSQATAAKSVPDITRAADVEQRSEQRNNKRQRRAQSSIVSSRSAKQNILKPMRAAFRKPIGARVVLNRELMSDSDEDHNDDVDSLPELMSDGDEEW